MGKIETRMAAALTDADTKQFAVLQLDAIRLGAVDAEQAIMRFGRGILILAGSFVLIDASAVPNVDLLGLTITNVRIILPLLPAVVTFLYFRMGAQVIRHNALLAAFTTIVRTVYPDAHNHDLQIYVVPPLLGPERIIARHAEGPAYRKFQNASAPLIRVLQLGPLFFVGYGYWRCFGRWGIDHFGVWLSLMLSLLILVQYLTYLYASDGLNDPT